ncbi:MAG: transposase [Patescibacteria group bacterium]
MPRPERISLEGFVYHVINRGNNRQDVFKDNDDFTAYLEIIKRFKTKYQFKLYAYCLMNNHVHLIIEPTKPNTLSKIVQSITLSHIRLYHYKYKSSGHIWQGRFKNPLIQTDEYLLECIKYIELNPVRANIVSKPEDYLWSSYRFHSLGEDKNKLLDSDPTFLSLANTDKTRQKAYRDFITTEQDEDMLDSIRKSIANGCILGENNFIDKIKQKISFARPKLRGRPRLKLINS